jgi:diguanylate cyclase (GGDEF)-like protein
MVTITIGNFGILLLAENHSGALKNHLLQSHQVIKESEHLLGYMQRAELEQFRLQLVPDAQQKNSFMVDVQEVFGSFTRLQTLVEGNAVQQAELKRVFALIKKMVSGLEQMNQGNRQGETLVVSEQGRMIMDKFRAELKQFILKEEISLRGYESTFEDSQRNLRLLFVLEAIVLSLLVIVATLLTRGSLVRPLVLMRKVISNEGEVNNLDALTAMGNDEVGGLAKAFHEMYQDMTQRTEALHTQARFEQTFSKIAVACASSNILTTALHKALVLHSSNPSSPLSAIYVQDENSDQLHCLVSVGTSDALERELSPDSGMVGEVFRSGQRATLNIESIKGFQVNTGVVQFQPHTVVLQPIQHGERTLGVFVLAYTTPPAVHDLNYISNLANHFGVTIVNSEQYSKLQLLTEELEKSRNEAASERDEALLESITDPLTGLYNRRYMLLESEMLIAITTRYNYSLSLLIMDIDFFKSINDTWGHTVGDDVLKALAVALKQQSRESDLVVRYGGEEFISILPQATMDEAEEVAEKLRKTVEALIIPELGGKHITISLGVSTLEPEEKDIEALIARADQALYQAKESGRNRVCRS